MTEFEAIQKIKYRIKSLGAKQMVEKALLGNNHNNCPRSVRDLMVIVNFRRVEITALLNFYLDLRNKKYRHNVKLADKTHYEQIVDKIAKEFMIEEEIVAA